MDKSTDVGLGESFEINQMIGESKITMENALEKTSKLFDFSG